MNLTIIEKQILIISREMSTLDKNSGKYRLLSDSLYMLIKWSIKEDLNKRGL